MIPFEDATTLSLLYHLNSEPWRNDEAYRGDAYRQEFLEVESPVSRASLPPAPDSPLSRLIRLRRSCRAYLPRAMPLGPVSALAAAAYGIVETAVLEGDATFLRRSVPSAGGLFPLELFVFLQRVEGLSDGLYHYDVRGHALELLPGGGQIADLAPFLYPHPFVRDANLVFAVAAVFGRNQKKYGPRGYRYTLLEAGHSAQNICLRAVELGLGTLCMGGFEDSRLNRVLGFDPAKGGVVYAVAVGYEAQAAQG
jgi:SagB-type dehydrogenase family enzyme